MRAMSCPAFACKLENQTFLRRALLQWARVTIDRLGRDGLICSARNFSACLLLLRNGMSFSRAAQSLLPEASSAKAVFCSGNNSSLPRASTSGECLAKNFQRILNCREFGMLVFIEKIGRRLADRQNIRPLKFDRIRVSLLERVYLAMEGLETFV